jgi:hypothetical protein
MHVAFSMSRGTAGGFAALFGGLPLHTRADHIIIPAALMGLQQGFRVHVHEGCAGQADSRRGQGGKEGGGGRETPYS